METESGCKISIRGKGATKRQGDEEEINDKEPLHVLLIGDTDEAVDKARRLIEPLLRNVDDDIAKKHKMKQLMTLAEYNGVDRENNPNVRVYQEDVCEKCGLDGHKSWQCQVQNIACPLCSEWGHTAGDCQLRDKTNQDQNAGIKAYYKHKFALKPDSELKSKILTYQDLKAIEAETNENKEFDLLHQIQKTYGDAFPWELIPPSAKIVKAMERTQNPTEQLKMIQPMPPGITKNIFKNQSFACVHY